MSNKSSGDATLTEESIIVTKPPKCRIPLRSPMAFRGQKSPTAKNTVNNDPPARRGNFAPPPPTSPGRTATAPAGPRPLRSRPHSTESGRKEEVSSVKSSIRPPRIYVPEKERGKVSQRSPMPVRKVNIDKFATPSKLASRPVITVPLTHDTMKTYEEFVLKHLISDLGVNKKELAADKIVDVNKLNNIPNKLIATCEQTLAKRKEIIDWFEKLRQEERAISMNKLAQKVKEFNAENEMLNSTLQKVKSEFLKEISDIVDCVRKGLNDTIAMQLRTEDMMYELTELNSQNADLRKQIQAADHYKSPSIRHKLEEAEKELKEERCEKMLTKKRLTRAEGQIKIGQERAEQLEGALQQARERMWNLENTIQHQNEQNQKLQNDFDQELNKLTDSIRENTLHVEKIGRAREKLQTEKEDLEKRLQELSESYSESLENMRLEVNKNIAKLAETENKFEEEKAERTKLEFKLESLCAQLLESELRYKDTIKLLQEKDVELNLRAESLKKLETTKQQLEMANNEIEEQRNRLMAQSETIKEIEHNFKEAINLESRLRNELTLKDEYASELETKHILLERQMQESERKMACYEDQLNTLKNHITDLKDDFGDFDNLIELRDIVTNQRTKLLESTNQNSDLAEKLQKKESELEEQKETFTKLERRLEQREALLRKLKEKEEEQTNIIKLLRNNVEIRTEADNEFTQQIDALNTSLEARKIQICQLEQIVLTLEDQVRKLNNQRKLDQDKIMLLEKTIASYENCQNESQNMEVASDNLDNLIRILEDELGSPFDPRLGEQDYHKKKNNERIRREKMAKFEAHARYENTPYQTEPEKIPTKIVMGNFVKKTYNISSNNERYKGDAVDHTLDCILDRKKAITNMEPHFDKRSVQDEILPLPPHKSLPTSPRDQLTRNLHFYLNNQVQEKKCKMFKFAGHRL